MRPEKRRMTTQYRLARSIIISCLMLFALTLAGCTAPEENERKLLREQGIGYMGAGDYNSAAKAFEMALIRSNGIVKKMDIDMSYYLGVSQYKLARYEDAKDTFSAIIGIDEEQENAWYMRGKVELTDGDKTAALSDYDQAVALAPSKYSLYQKIYMDLCDAGYEADAGAYIERAVSANEKMSDYQRGIFAYYTGNYDEARNDLERARNEKKGDENTRLLIYLGRSYDALGDTDYAGSLFQTWLQGHEPDATVYNELGLIRLKMKDYTGALDAFEKGIELEEPGCLQSLRFNEIVACERM
nr:tetratricopeptide repeat protein [Lachnospiraceae bacterium]